MKMHRLVLLIVCSAAALLGAAAEDGAPRRLRVGVILPLSGAGAAFGTRVRQSIEMAHAELPADLRKTVQVFYEDDGWEPAKAVSAFQKLADTEHIDAALVIGSAPGMVVAPLAEKRQIVLMAIGASNRNVVKGRNYCFLNWVTPENEARLLAREVRRRGYKRLALVGAEHEGMLAIYNAVMAELQKTGLADRIVLDERYAANETDYRTFIAQARAKEAEGLMLFLLPGSLSSFAKQARQSGVKADLIGIELFEDDDEVKASDGALIGQWYVTAASSPDFEKKFRARYQRNSAFGTANGYDALNLIVKGFQASPAERVSDGVARYLATLQDYQGAAGTYSATGDNRFTLPAGVRVVREHGYEDVKAAAE